MPRDEPTAELSPADATSSFGRRATALVAAALASAGIAAALLMEVDDSEKVAADGDGGAPAIATTIATTTTSVATTTTTTAVATTAPTSATTSPTVVPPTTTSVVVAAPTTTTTARPRKPGFTITPPSGPAGTQAEASGAGCTGPAAGIELTLLEPSGEPYTGDGAAAMADGTWRVPFSFPPGGARGAWTMTATCKAGGGVTVVEYQPETFTVT